MSGVLYKKSNYLNKDIDYLISNEIIEYDIRSAGFNISKYFKLLPQYKINYLEKLGKKQRHIQLGLYQREDKEFKKILNEKFMETRKWFFENNDVGDEEILSVKKDALFVLKRCKNISLGNIEFIEKNVYTSYYYLNNLEFYYNKNTIDVKGIDDELLKLHEDYMLNFLHEFFRLNEVNTRKMSIKLLKQFAKYYKSKRLDIGYYRELDKQSLFRLKERLFGEIVGAKYTEDIDKVDMWYNYKNYVIPLISILI